MKNKKVIITISVILIVALLISLLLFWELGVYRLQQKNGEYWLRYRNNKLYCAGDALVWSIDECESIGIVYDTGLFTYAYGNDSNAIYYQYPMFGGSPECIYVSENIDCDIKNDIFDSISLAHTNGTTSRQTLDALINAYTICIPYSGPELHENEMDKVGTIYLDHAEIEWLHMDYTVYWDGESYYCHKLNGVYEDGEFLEDKTWFVLTDEALVAWFSEQQD